MTLLPGKNFASIRTSRWRPEPTAFRRYALALLLSTASITLRIILNPLLGTRVPWAIFFPAVLYSTWFGGIGPGVLSITLCGIATAWFWLPLVGPAANHPAHELGLALYLGISLWLAVVAANRKRAAAEITASEARFHALFDTVATVLLWLGPDGRLIEYNREAGQLFGWTRQEVLGKNYLDFLPPEVRPAVAADLAKVVAGSVTRGFENKVRTQDGSEHILLWNVQRLLDLEGNVSGVIAAGHDISEQRHSEEALRQSEARYRETADALGEANRRKDEFLATLAHELRNPLAPIRNAVHLLRLTGADEQLLPRAREIIDRQVTHLSRLIDDLLDVSRLAHGKILLRKEPLDLVPLLRTVIDDHRQMLESAKLALELKLPDEALWVMADPTRISQVIANVLQNAIKFTEAGGHITISLQPDRQTQQVLLRVCDTGVGMEPETLKRVFHAFSQADRTLARTRGGLGLGLALVKGLIELHGGSVEAASPGLGQGSEVSIRVPLVPAPLSSRIPEPSDGASKLHRVLIIEDNWDAAESLRLLLECVGHVVAVAYDGSSGLAKAREFRPQLILCDIGLPGALNGYEVAKACRSDPQLRHVFLVALTGYGQEEDRRRALDAGFDTHVTKPADLATIEGVLESVPS